MHRLEEAAALDERQDQLSRLQAEFLAALEVRDLVGLRLEYADLLAQAGEWQAAGEEYQRVLRTAFCENDNRLQSVTLNQMACLSRQQGDYAQAAEFQRRSFALELSCEDCDDAPSVPTELGNLAADAIAAGDLSFAEELLHRSLLCEITEQSLEGQAADYGNLAIIHSLRGDYRAAISFLRRTLAMHRQLQDHRAIGSDLMNLAAIYEAQQRWTRSSRLLTLAISRLKSCGAADLVAEAEAALAQVKQIGRLRSV